MATLKEIVLEKKPDAADPETVGRIKGCPHQFFKNITGCQTLVNTGLFKDVEVDNTLICEECWNRGYRGEPMQGFGWL